MNKGQEPVPDAVQDFVSRDGSRIWVICSGKAVEPPDLTKGTIWIMEDITERMQAEKDLRESNQRFSTMFHASPIAIGISRMDTGVFVDANEAFFEQFGYPREEVVGHTSTELGLWPVLEEREFILKELRECGRVRHVEAAFRHKSGILGYLLISAELIELDGEKYLMGMLSDITARKSAEMILSGINDKLEREVAERTASLSEANRQLTQEIEERKKVQQEIIDHQLKLQKLALELSMAEERERDRIAGELHDQVGQRLILVKMRLNEVMGGLSGGEVEDDAEELEVMIDQSIQDIRSLTFQIRPPLLATAGLEAALRWLSEELRADYGLLVELSDDKRPKPLPYEVRSTVFQATRELLLNVAKHAGTSDCRVRLAREDDLMVVDVEDDGVGLKNASFRGNSARGGGFGLFNLRQRIEYLGGSFAIETRAQGGVHASFKVPLEAAKS